MIKPPVIKKGDMIGVIAPASPSGDERREKAKLALEEMGFSVKMGRSCYYKCGYLAGSDELRAQDINTMFADSEVKGIICLRGGYGTLRILNKLDYELIKNNPKVFMGYSDITAIHIALNQKCKLVTFHGPMVESNMADGLDEFSYNSFFTAALTNEPIGEIQNPSDETIKCLIPGICSGKIVGGNLALIAAGLGTPYEIDTKGKLLFLEDIDEKPYRVDRMLTQLSLAGKLRDANGIILGDWKNCEADTIETQTLAEVFQDILTAAGKPTVYNLRSGHCRPMITLPLGVECIMHAKEGKLFVNESAVVC